MFLLLRQGDTMGQSAPRTDFSSCWCAEVRQGPPSIWNPTNSGVEKLFQRRGKETSEKRLLLTKTSKILKEPGW